MEEIKNINTEVALVEELELTDDNAIDTNIIDVDNLEDDTPDLTEMSFKPIKKIIEYKNKEGKTKRIKIYNVDNEKNDELMKIVMQYSTISDDGQVNTNIPSLVVIDKVMRILTNIKFPEDEDQINAILENPDDYLKEALLLVTKILKKTMEINFESLEMTKDSLEKMGLTNDKIMEMAKQQKEIQELTVQAEKEKQETERIKTENNEEEVKKLAQALQEEKTKNLELLVKLEENGVQTEKKKRGRPKKVVESKRDENPNE